MTDSKLFDLDATPARLALLRDVLAGNVITGDEDAPGEWLCLDFGPSPRKGDEPRQVTEAIHEMQMVGWVDRPGDGAIWGLTDTGHAVLRIGYRNPASGDSA